MPFPDRQGNYYRFCGKEAGEFDFKITREDTYTNIGTEEILIIATAAFLFFSKGGDRECALILLLLLFIN